MPLLSNIVIADDHPLFRQAIVGALSDKLTQCHWHQAENVEQLMAILQSEQQLDLLLLDLNIPGAHGFNTLIQVHQHYPKLPIIVVSAYDDNDTINQVMQYGAQAFVPKSTPVDTIVEALNDVMAGRNWTPAGYNLAQNDKQDVAQKVASLTQQQYKILMMFAEGLLNKQIAYELNVSEATIKAHATAIFKKLNVRNRTQAVITLSELDLNHSEFLHGDKP